jgi:hypothetical protein
VKYAFGHRRPPPAQCHRPDGGSLRTRLLPVSAPRPAPTTRPPPPCWPCGPG